MSQRSSRRRRNYSRRDREIRQRGRHWIPDEVPGEEEREPANRATVNADQATSQFGTSPGAEA